MGELEPRSVFAGHRIDAVAGRGGMGVVYRATQLALDRTVALKVIAPGLLEDQTVRQRFVRESKVAASIDHPNVIPIYYAGEENGIAYIAMRYVAGDDVRSLVRREGRLPAERAARIVSQVGAALDAAHGAGLVHRDIKPANVLLTSEDHVYLTDFGLTKHALSIAGTTKPGHWVGTLDYVAPEQIRGERVDARADVYALGCLLFYALTGEVPFKREGDEARLWAHLSDPPPKPSMLVPNLPGDLDAVVERALAKHPDERYQSAGDLGRAALAAAAGRRPAERERLVAKGAAAPVESETVTAARPPVQSLRSNAQVEAETVALERSRFSRGRRPALFATGFLVAAAGGVIAAAALGVGQGDPPSKSTAIETPAPKKTPVAANAMRVGREITIGHRPNVVKVVDGNVFVGSFKRPAVSILSAKSGRPRSVSPTVGLGITDAAVGSGSVWFAVSRAKQVVRLSARTGKPQGAPIPLPGGPGSIAVSPDAIWVGLVNAGAPDVLLKIDRRTGETLQSVQYPYGIISIATSPSAVWVVSRRRSRVQRVDPATAQVVRTVQFGRSRGADIEYRDGAVWIPSPADDTVYKVLTRTGDIIPIGVGRQPRQVALGDDGRVYVTNYNSSDLYAIDEKRSRVDGPPVGLAVNPFGLAAANGAVWVASQPDNRLAEVLTGRGG